MIKRRNKALPKHQQDDQRCLSSAIDFLSGLVGRGSCSGCVFGRGYGCACRACCPFDFCCGVCCVGCSCCFFCCWSCGCASSSYLPLALSIFFSCRCDLLSSSSHCRRLSRRLQRFPSCPWFSPFPFLSPSS